MYTFSLSFDELFLHFLHIEHSKLIPTLLTHFLILLKFTAFGICGHLLSININVYIFLNIFVELLTKYTTLKDLTYYIIIKFINRFLHSFYLLLFIFYKFNF